ncbi:MAG TPA: SusD/RagB family nutrient-binding outer membrane lipoprotein [Chitinophagaceae bacterium]|nr:SusD/RagB family nutrient-binding outer membrane lipoprotein [Chitinophagaceae bacterium]HMU57716.1 SusD/RagB family nutrient-binding outer membrane lipoprotein [Chitinophagaceae bacterium]
MRKIIAFTFLLGLLITGIGCKKGFLDINDNPNSPTETSITPNLLLPRIEHQIANIMATGYSVQGRWMGYWARSGTYGPTVEEESYHITTQFGSTWAAWYDVLMDIDIMEKKAIARNETYYSGIAKALKTIGFMYLVDNFNNVPYTKAFDLGGNILPSYDKGEDIYADLFTKLTQAQDLITNATIGANLKIADADLLFKGDKLKWRKFINTQRLKLLIRQSQIPGFSPAAEIAKITADGSGFIGAGETVSVNPGYVADNNKQNPYWNAYKKLYTGGEADQYNRANNFVLNLYRSNLDIRYQYVFSRAASPVGSDIYYGFNYGELLPNNDPHNAGASSDVAGPGLAKSASQSQWLLTSVESLFLQAEAIQRGWLTGNAQTMYENAVKESFIWLGVSDAVNTANTYLAQANPVMNWSMATTSDAKIKLIVLQKYLALPGINNFEAWVDYRRLGVPSTLPMSMSPSRQGYIIPIRLHYPQSEYNLNNANVKAQGDINPQSSAIFWDK